MCKFWQRKTKYFDKTIKKLMKLKHMIKNFIALQF